jgi:hypothetical protein
MSTDIATSYQPTLLNFPQKEGLSNDTAEGWELVNLLPKRNTSHGASWHGTASSGSQLFPCKRSVTLSPSIVPHLPFRSTCVPCFWFPLLDILPSFRLRHLTRLFLLNYAYKLLSELPGGCRKGSVSIPCVNVVPWIQFKIKKKLPLLCLAPVFIDPKKDPTLWHLAVRHPFYSPHSSWRSYISCFYSPVFLTTIPLSYSV